MRIDGLVGFLNESMRLAGLTVVNVGFSENINFVFVCLVEIRVRNLWFSHLFSWNLAGFLLLLGLWFGGLLEIYPRNWCDDRFHQERTSFDGRWGLSKRASNFWLSTSLFRNSWLALLCQWLSDMNACFFVCFNLVLELLLLLVASKLLLMRWFESGSSSFW